MLKLNQKLGIGIYYLDMLAGLLCVKKAIDGTKIWIEFNCTAFSGTSSMTVVLLFYLLKIQGEMRLFVLAWFFHSA